MRITTWLCSSFLILFGLCVSLYALTGINLGLLITVGNIIAYRALLSFSGVCALWLLFWLIAFRPIRFLA